MREILLKIAVVLVFFLNAAQGQNISFLQSKNIPLHIPTTGSSVTYHTFVSGDFNGDGKLDFVVSSTDLVLSSPMTSYLSAMLELGNGDGSFKSVDLPFAAKVIVATVPGAYDESLLAADVNNDGKLDLIIRIGTQTSLFLGNGDGSFQSGKLLPAFPLAIADFTKNGKSDLLVETGSLAADLKCGESSLNVYPGNGDGSFNAPLPCSAASIDGDWGTRTFVVRDLNGDGHLDLVWGNARSANLIYVWLGNGDGTFKAPYAVLAGTGQGGKPIALGDLNHDGKLDIVVGTHYGVAVLLGNGDGTFQNNYPETATAPRGPLFLPYSDAVFNLNFSRSWLSNDIFIRDFDGDGNQDILLDDALFRGNGDGTFQPAQYLGTPSPKGFSSVISVICGDFNGDGKPDIIHLTFAPDSSPSALSIVLNNSPNGLPSNVFGYSAPTGGSLLTPSSIASLYGKTLAKSTASAASTTLPTQLGGISLRVRDGTDTVRLAQLIFVSPTQINFVVPADTSIGPVTFNIDDGTTPFQEGANATIVTAIAPGFFTVNQTGSGAPAATAVRIRLDGTQEPVAVFTCTGTGQCSAAPIDMVSGLPVYLSLYGTGFRQGVHTPLRTDEARCQVSGKNATVQFAGPHSMYPGLDQLNLLIPQSLSSGQAPVQCSFSSIQSNTVSIAIK